MERNRDRLRHRILLRPYEEQVLVPASLRLKLQSRVPDFIQDQSFLFLLRLHTLVQIFPA
eukprot:1117885-Rhodomonas_salina.1